MHNPKSILEKETYKNLLNFEIKVHHLISARRPDLETEKKTCRIVQFAVPADHWVNWKRAKSKTNRNILEENWKKKTVEHESDSDTNSNQHVRRGHQRIRTGTGGYGNKRTCGDDLNYKIVEIGQNTKKSPGKVWTLGVTQNLMDNH